MEESWWPQSLAHIAKDEPWVHPDVMVAEIKSFEDGQHCGQRRAFTVLIPVDSLDAVMAAAAGLDHEVSSSGPLPIYRADHPHTPKFWVDARELPDETYEPLVLSWRSHDRTVLQLDPGFLMTYGLIPRGINDGAVHWDDPRAPRPNVATVTAPSAWDFPRGTHAYVTIAKDYLQDYLSLRHMALVQIYWEMRWSPIDKETEVALKGEEGVEVKFADRCFQLGRAVGDKKTVCAQVWGARLLAKPGTLPISEDSLDVRGLKWPGIEEVVTNDAARGLDVLAFAYVDDAVLAAYEGRPEFSINPRSGSVSHGTQWGVGFCSRVGRNLIRVELKKLYEGVPDAVTRHWHRYAVAPLPLTAYPAANEERNIARRAEDVVYGVVRLGEALSALAHTVRMEIPPEDFVGLRRAALDYQGWWTFDVAEAVARHVPMAMMADAFLDRCMNLEKLVLEGIREGNLRKILLAIGVPGDEIKDLRSLKLLDRIVCLAQVSDAVALTLQKDGAVVWDRLKSDGTKPEQPVGQLFALHDVRILKAHRANDRANRLQEELKRFGIKPGEEGAGYGQLLDRIYDILTSELTGIATKIESCI